MKIVNILSSKTFGGVEQAFLNYNSLLSSSNHEIFAIFNKNGKIRDRLENFKNIKYLPSIFFKPHFLLFPYFYFKIRKIKPDFIIVQSRKVLSLFAKIGKVLNIPVIVVAHGDKIKFLNKADYIFAITQSQKDNFIKNGFKNDKIFIIPNFINEKVEFKEFENFLNPIVFGTMSRFEASKGLNILIEACKILKDKKINFKVRIAGSPEKQYTQEYKKILNLIEKYNLKDNIHFIGWIQDKKDFYNNIDIFVLSSIHESFGIVLLEAMMYSKPIISSLADGPKEIFKHDKNSLTFEVGDYKKLSELMIKILNDKNLAKKSAKDNYDLVNEKYTLEYIRSKVNNILSSIKK